MIATLFTVLRSGAWSLLATEVTGCPLEKGGVHSWDFSFHVHRIARTLWLFGIGWNRNGTANGIVILKRGAALGILVAILKTSFSQRISRTIFNTGNGNGGQAAIRTDGFCCMRNRLADNGRSCRPRTAP